MNNWFHSLIHPLPAGTTAPSVLNDPFDYEPDEAALVAWREMKQQILSIPEWQEEVAKGKMFGVLVVRADDGSVGYLAAYSGQINDRSDWKGFAPAVFDYLQLDGYFKTHEAAITQLNHQLDEISKNADFIEGKNRLEVLRKEAEEALAQQANINRFAKLQRDQRRMEGYLSASETGEMIRESQFMKAELRRKRQAYAERIAAAEKALAPWEGEMQRLKLQRKNMSDSLQQWLFNQFLMLNSKGERRSLPDIFATTPQQVPPSGSGECCEPKLLQYAFAHHLTPLSMAMFWLGASPKDVVRHEDNHYPACSGKCKPILGWMLGGVSLRPGPHAQIGEGGQLTDVYNDEYLCVVDKPSGMLSVPGRSGRPSVVSLLREKWGGACEPFVVHRLDMATSGLLMVAKSAQMQRQLQQMFAGRQVEKTYIALLEEGQSPAEGIIDLPLRPDVLNRPYQIVDEKDGKPSVTSFRMLSADRIELHPLTGRTHQLRVHCAHQQGLSRPIKGDVLYGHAADRLYLHAAVLCFTHPVTGKKMRLSAQPPF